MEKFIKMTEVSEFLTGNKNTIRWKEVPKEFEDLIPILKKCSQILKGHLIQYKREKK